MERSREGSVVIALADRPSLSTRLISPTASPGPRKARITSPPPGWSTKTLTVPARIT
jgi:hypothetical protein